MYKMRALVTVMGAVFCACALLLIPTTAHAQSCVEAPEGLISWWPGDGDANDIEGNNDGTLQGGATFAPGKVGQAFNLDGVDDYVSIPDSHLYLGEFLVIFGNR